MIEFELKGIKYRADAMSARTQFHVVRRIAKIFEGLSSLLGSTQDENEKKDKATVAQMGAALISAVGSLPDADADYIIDACLDTVKRDMGKGLGWADLRKDGVQMYRLSLFELGGVLFYVLKGNLDGFFAELPPEVGTTLTNAQKRATSAFQAERTGSSDPPSEA